MSAKKKHSNQAETLTSWEAENRQCQQGRNRTKQSDSHPGKQRARNVNWGKTEQQSREANMLEGRGQAVSPGEKQSNKAEALTG